MPAPQAIIDLIARFEEHKDAYHAGAYSESELRTEFIDPFFEVMGWDIANKAGFGEQYKDVVREASVNVEGAAKKPDYEFRIGGTRKFYLEAKKPSVNLKNDIAPAFQIRRYAWSAKLPLGILTDFEEMAVYDCRNKPKATDKAGVGRIYYYSYKDYADKWDEITSIFSKEAIQKGAFDKFAISDKKRGTETVDKAFLNEIEDWRAMLAQNIALRNGQLTVEQLNYSVQQTIDRIIFLRICEDRGIESYGDLQKIMSGRDAYQELLRHFAKADDRYNSGLFHFKRERDNAEPPDDLTPSLSIDDKPLKDIAKRLYYPNCPYEFSVISADILGQVYERFLGKVIRLTAGHQAKVEDKPEVKKAGGVYYTPTYIVDYIVKNTVGKLVEGKTPAQVDKLKVLDPACGSGSFLIGAYQFLLDWYLEYYASHEPAKLSKGKDPKLYQAEGGGWKLSLPERRRILLNNIHGVDIDGQAVEVTKLSLCLKVLEGVQQISAFGRVLPDLSANIKCGNSLIGTDYFTDKLIADPDEMRRINAFDWETEFPGIISVRGSGATRELTGGFDAVIGNPPYVDSESMTKDLSEWRDYCRERYIAASGNWDLFCVFIEKALALCKTNGLSSYIVPNKLGSAGYAAGARTIIHNNTLLSIRDYSNVAVFNVSVYPIVYIVKSGQRMSDSGVVFDEMISANTETAEVQTTSSIGGSSFESPEDPWPIFSNLDTTGLVARLRAKFTPLGSVADVRGAATVGEAYDMKPLISSHAGDLETSLKVINSGTIDRYVSMWGLKEMRYLGEKYSNPLVSDKALGALSQKRLTQSRTQKIIIAGMTKRLECAIDLDGETVGAKSTTVVFSDMNLRYLLGLLNSKLMNCVFDSVFGGNKLSGGYLRIGPPQLKALPIRVINVTSELDMQCQNHVIDLVDQMLLLSSRAVRVSTSHEKDLFLRQIEATDRQIDQLVYELYSLSEEEIKIVEANS